MYDPLFLIADFYLSQQAIHIHTQSPWKDTKLGNVVSFGQKGRLRLISIWMWGKYKSYCTRLI